MYSILSTLLTILTTVFIALGDQSCKPDHRCVPKHLCTNISSTGKGLIDLRLGDDTDLCGNSSLQCCLEKDIIMDIPSSVALPSMQSGSRDGSQESCGDGQRCVQKYLCSNESTSGVNLIDIRFSDDNPCVDYLLQCCYEEDIIARQLPSSTSSPVVPPIEGPKCGKRNSDGIGFRITGQQDKESEYGEFPWMMALLTLENLAPGKTNKVYHCGASLIHPKVVLTAAHCVEGKKPTQLTIRGGEWDTQTENEIYQHQDRNVAEIKTHPKYNRVRGLHNDIALLFLDAPFELHDNIQPVCLPPQGSNFNHKKCFASGWGKDIFGNPGKYQAILKKIEIPVVPFDRCQTQLRATRLGPGFNLHNSFICAGGKKEVDTCTGDGGSPLVCPIGESHEYYYQAGIVAWGIGCGQENVPGVYVDAALFRDWTDGEMKKRKLDISSYSADN